MKGAEGLLPILGFRLRQSFLALCLDMVLYVAKGFSGCSQLLGRDRSFPGRDRVVFFGISIARRVLPVSR